MSRGNDVWFVRLPDGRVVRAKTTASVRHHLETGRIPPDSRVRRHSEEDWATLDWTPEFADLAGRRPARVEGRDAARTRPGDSGDGRGLEEELRTVGVRGMVEELLAALDSALQRRKLAVAALLGLTAGLMLLLAGWWPHYLPTPWPWLPAVAAGLGFVVVASVCVALLTQMTVIELSRFRPASLREARAGLGRHVGRLLPALLLVTGLVLGLIVLLRWLPGELVADPGEDAAGTPVFAGAVAVLGLLIEVVLWPLLGFALLLGPAAVVDEGTTGRTLAVWWSLLRRHLSRVLLYVALAFALGLITTAPVLLPVLLAGWFDVPDPTLALTVHSARTVLVGLALTPLICYLIVASVFIYLNLRYEFSLGGR